jgi:hypothetical protein
MSKLAAAIRADAWISADTPGWAASIFVPRSLLESEVIEAVKIGVGPCVAAVPHELVRVHFDGLAVVPHGDVFKRTLIREIEPFIIGIGHVVAHDTLEGFVLCRAGNGSDEFNDH